MILSAVDQKIELNDGTKIPGFGYGCYKAEGQELVQAINCAIVDNYRLLDTASYYGNEKTVGEALAKNPESKQLYIISKIWPTEFSHPVACLDRSLKDLRLEKIDAYLLHWPGLDQKLRYKTYEALLREQEKGKIGSLGVSNFLIEQLRELATEFGNWPSLNQIESHPFFPQDELCAFCHANNVAVMAWSPLGRGNELHEPTLEKIAAEKNKSMAQIILRWHIQANRIPIPKSVHPQRIRENSEIFDFDLSGEEMSAINALARPDGRRGQDPLVFPA